MTRTESALRAMVVPLRRAFLLGWSLRAALVVLAAFAAGAWALRLGLVRPGAAVIVTWLAAAVGLGAVVAGGRRAVGALGPRAVALRLETAGAGRRGAVVALLEPPAQGTSAGLVMAADARMAQHLADVGDASLLPWVAALRHRVRQVGLGAAIAAALLLAARPATGQARLLWSPGAALEWLSAPVSLRADPPVVTRGGRTRLIAEAPGLRSAELWSRLPGQPWSREQVSLDTLGRFEQEITGVTTDRFYVLTAGGRSSDTVAVLVRVPAFLGSLQARALYPAYLGLEDEPLAVPGDTLLLPAGTELEFVGEASVPLSSATWTRDGEQVDLAPEGPRFRGRFRPADSGSWDLSLRPADGSPVAGDPVRLSIRLIPDRPPEVEIPVPGADTVAALDLRVTLAVDAADDHGLRRLEVVSQAGSRPAIVTAVPLPAGGTERVMAPVVLDLSDLGLVPGDTVSYYAVAGDNSPAGQAGRSRTYLIVVPTPADQRAARREVTAQAGAQLDSLTMEARRLERQTEDLARQRIRTGESARGEPAMGFEEARRAEAVASSQEEAIRNAEALQETLEALQEAAERGAAPDSALARRLEEIRAQLDRALSPELRARLAQLQQALKALDPEATREALRELSETQQVLREALERSRELLKRAALEGELGALAQDARDLAREQGRWNQEAATADSSAAAERQDGMAERADSLARGLEEAAGQLSEREAQEEMRESAERAREAAGEMRQAGTEMRRGRRQQAQSRGESAESDLDQVGQSAEQQRQQQQQAWRQDVIDGIDRAMAESARLARQQLGVAEAFREGRMVGPARADQALLEESAQKLVEQMTALSGSNALVSPQIAVALAVARRQMGLARDAVSSASPNLREAAERAGEAVDALNVATYGMVRARDDVSGSSSGSGLAEAMERMTRMAQSQGQLSQQGGQLLPMAGTPSLQMQLQALAAQQRALAQQLERMRAEGQIPGAKQMGEEARELARALEAGRLDRETVARQEQLFRRMLDAGRTLEGEERDERKERQSTSAQDAEVRLPTALRGRLGGPALPMPSWESLQRLSPEARRMVTDYFRRLTAGGSP
ncbi:MAG TPA: DUF4175 family protein [Gemmatimonadales bacterium]